MLKFKVCFIVKNVYEKGNRARAVNYRLVALTSDIIKIYDRIIRSTMVIWMKMKFCVIVSMGFVREGFA